jgi:hypothetical protein
VYFQSKVLLKGVSARKAQLQKLEKHLKKVSTPTAAPLKVEDVRPQLLRHDPM